MFYAFKAGLICEGMVRPMIVKVKSVLFPCSTFLLIQYWLRIETLLEQI